MRCTRWNGRDVAETTIAADPAPRFTVLRGTVGVDLDGEPVAIGGPMQRKLLAALLADHDRIVSADRLVESIWAEDAAPDGARRTVMSYVSRLRSSIGGAHLVTRDPGYQLVLDGASYDAIDFELALARARASDPDGALAAYDDALALWSGRAFGDDADEWWLRPVATRLEELRLVALEERAEHLLDAGRAAEAVADLQGLAAEQPLRERFVELLMRALHLSGRQAEALRAYQAFRTYLADETGLEPSSGLADLERRITRGDASLAPGAGDAVPGYDLLEVIGEGAFGVVYRAVQPSVGREVAVKVVRAALADDRRFVQRFEAEAHLVARLEHPHVVPLYDFWRRPGGAFLVFRLLRGGSLHERIQDGPLPIAEATRLVDELGAALGAAHALGVVHRDVKPANVLFDESGNSYLADFGIALADGATDDALRSAGSPMYASPEQVRDATATAASDQYALAVVLWEALTGRPPFTGTSTTEIVRSKLGAPLRSLGGEASSAPVDEVLRRATAPNPDDRFESVTELVRAWHRALADPRTDALRTTGRLDADPAGRAGSHTLASIPAVVSNPFKGLRSFREADAAEFHGRDALVERLLEAVAAERFVAVVGPSGSGKSSLVHAGVVPALRGRGALVASLVPGTDPFAELETALRQVANTEVGATIAARLRMPDGLARLAAELAPSGAELVLVVDQFEELWTLVGDDAVRDRFAELLVRGADATSRLRIVATLRADLYDRPLQHPGLGELVSGATFAVTPMSSSELADAIECPAAQLGVRFEPGLVATMVSEVSRQPGSLPLLQFTLTELYELRADATITAEAYERLGGIGGALASRAEALFTELEPAGQQDLRQLFSLLVSTDHESGDLRRRARLEELEGIDRAVVERCRQNRLLVTDHHPVTREPTVEVAHEALLREWPRLRGWIHADRDAIRQRRGLVQAARAWDADGRDESALLRGTRLVAAAEIAATTSLTAVERDLLTASQDAADRERVEREARSVQQERQNRRLRRLVGAVAVVLALAVLAGAVALNQRGQAREAAAAAERSARSSELGRLIADAKRLASSNPDLALLLAAEAARRAPGAASADALATALTTNPDLVRFVGDTATPRAGGGTSETAGDWPAHHPTSGLLAVPDSAAGTIRVVDLASGDVARELPIPDARRDDHLVSTAWTADDLLLLISSRSVVGIDGTTGEVRLPRTDSGGTIDDAAVSPDGDRLAFISSTSPDRATVTVLPLAAGGRAVLGGVPCCPRTTAIGTGRTEKHLTGSVAWRGDDLYVGSGSGTIVRWDAASGAPLETVLRDLGALWSMQFSDDGSRLYVGGAGPGGTADERGALQAYDTSGWSPLWDTPQPFLGAVADDPVHDAVRVADAFNGGTVVTLDRATGRPSGRVFPAPTGSACTAVLSPDSRYLTTGSCRSAALVVWSTDGGGGLLRRVADRAPGPTADTINATGTHLISSGAAGPVDVDLATGTTTPMPGLAAAVYASTGRLFAVDARGREGISTGPVDVPSAEVSFRWGPRPAPGPALAADVHDERDRVAITYDNQTVQVAEGFERIASVALDGERVTSLGLSADAKRLFVSGLDHLEVVQVDDPTRRTRLAAPAGRFVLSADRRLLVVSEADGTISFWDADTLRPRGTNIPGGPQYPTLALTPDESTLLVISSRGSLQLYDVPSRTQLGVELPVEASAPAVAPDSSVAYLPREGALVGLSLDRGDWLDRACHAAGRNLTRAEWAAYLGGTPRATCPEWPAPR